MGHESDTQKIHLKDSEEILDTVTVRLAPGGSEVVTHEWVTEEGDAGTYKFNVQSNDDRKYFDVRVTKVGAPYFHVTVDNTNSPIDEGETLTVDATVENVGDESDTQDIHLKHPDSTTLDTTAGLTLDSGENDQLTFTWKTERGDAIDEGEFTVESADHTASATVTVKQDRRGSIVHPPKRIFPTETPTPLPTETPEPPTPTEEEIPPPWGPGAPVRAAAARRRVPDPEVR